MIIVNCLNYHPRKRAVETWIRIMSVFYLREELKEKENLKEQGIPRTISLFEQPLQDG